MLLLQLAFSFHIGILADCLSCLPLPADNRYWTMWKLPMFGCTDPGQVLKEISNCERAFPDAYVRLVAFDPIRQVQVAGEQGWARPAPVGVGWEPAVASLQGCFSGTRECFVTCDRAEEGLFICSGAGLWEVMGHRSALRFGAEAWTRQCQNA